MVSIIVPIYNVSTYLEQCIESICAQTYRDLQIILVDDGSDDGSGEICDRYAESDTRIKVIHRANGGLVSARKLGLKHACGEYTACVDGDDWIENSMIEMALDTGQAEMICFAAYEEYADGGQGIKKNTVRAGLYQGMAEKEELYSKMLMNGNFFQMGILPYQWGKLIKTKILRQCQKNVPNSISYAEDAACIYPCLLKAESIYVSNERLYHYRVQQGSMVGKTTGTQKLTCLFKTLKNAFGRHPMAETLNCQLKYYIWQSMLLKGYRHIKTDRVLFPYEKVENRMRIAIYGAGLFGQVIEYFCRESGNLSVAGWFDKRYEAYCRQGLLVRPGDDAINTDFDVMVIAILDERLAGQIKKQYVRQGIPEGKIDIVSREVLDRYFLPESLAGGTDDV